MKIADSQPDDSNQLNKEWLNIPLFSEDVVLSKWINYKTRSCTKLECDAYIPEVIKNNNYTDS